MAAQYYTSVKRRYDNALTNQSHKKKFKVGRTQLLIWNFARVVGLTSLHRKTRKHLRMKWKMPSPWEMANTCAIQSFPWHSLQACSLHHFHQWYIQPNYKWLKPCKFHIQSVEAVPGDSLPKRNASQRSSFVFLCVFFFLIAQLELLLSTTSVFPR